MGRVGAGGGGLGDNFVAQVDRERAPHARGAEALVFLRFWHTAVTRDKRLCTVHKAWMAQPCRSSDMDATSTPLGPWCGPLGPWCGPLVRGVGRSGFGVGRSGLAWAARALAWAARAWWGRSGPGTGGAGVMEVLSGPRGGPPRTRKPTGTSDLAARGYAAPPRSGPGAEPPDQSGGGTGSARQVTFSDRPGDGTATGQLASAQTVRPG